VRTLKKEFGCSKLDLFANFAVLARATNERNFSAQQQIPTRHLLIVDLSYNTKVIDAPNKMIQNLTANY